MGQIHFDSSLLAGEDVVAFESLASEGIEVAVHADIDDADQTVHFVAIRTTATDKADGDKLVTGNDVTVADEVSYEGLTPGEEYVLDATLVDAETGNAVANGSATFTPESADGIQNVDIAFNGIGLGGKKLVVLEKLMKDGVQLATHEDPADADQTVTAVEIGTALTDAGDGDKTIVTGKVKLTDAVEYKGLVEGETYTVNGTLMAKSTGEALSGTDGKPVTATAEFAAKATDGTVEVTFELDASNLKEGDELVAFEELLTAEGNLAAEHKDIDDVGQTVVVDNPDTPEKPDEPGKGYPKTGATAVKAVAGVSLLVVAGCALAGAAYAVRKRRKDIAEAEGNDDAE